MTLRHPTRAFPSIALLAALLLPGCSGDPKPGQVVDEARLAGRAANTFKHADDPYFHDMDGAVTLTTQEEVGRNMWLVWSGGNDRFWDQMTQYTYGGFDLLKVISSHPSQGYSRSNRWTYLGLVNEPCFDKATGPDPNRRDLWLDVRSKDCKPDPFEDESKYPGVARGARGKPLGDGTSQPIGSFYGYATGILGLRLFPNPAFDQRAAKDWKPDLYYTDPNDYKRKDLVRPYRVGMSCGFCHVGPSPVNPPADPAHPAFANLSSSVGAQYMWVDRLFIHNADKPEGQSNYMFQLAHTFRPGSMDTSLVSTDSINNPRTMNAVYDFVVRLSVGKRLWHEKLAGGELDNKGGLKSEVVYRAHAAPSSAAGELRQVYARREVVVCGGAFNTPQLLMLSGIGPGPVLRAHGIAVRADVDGVGRNLQDRYEVAVTHRMCNPWRVLEGANFDRGDAAWERWSTRRSSMYDGSGAAIALVRRSKASLPEPDIFCMALPALFEGYATGFSQTIREHHDRLTWAVLKAHTHNRAGSVSLRSNDPRDPPLVTFRYFEEGDDGSGRDLKAVVEAIRFVRRLTVPLRAAKVIEEECAPGLAVDTDEGLADYVRNTAWGHHASCSCPIGAQADGGVLGSDFSVHGTRRLRVVDASVFPRIPGFFVAAAVYMVGEKAADTLLRGGAAPRPVQPHRTTATTS